MRSKDEARLQTACMTWVRLQYPHELIYAVPNGGSRNIIEAANLKKQGVLAGVFDINVDKARHGYHGLKIEMKRPGGKLTPAQKAYKAKCDAEGYLTAVLDTFDDFMKLINWYLHD